MKKARTYSNQFPVNRPVKLWGLYELGKLVMDRPPKQYNELVTRQKEMIASGINPLYLKIKPVMK